MPDVAARVERAWAKIRRKEYAAPRKEADILYAECPQRRDVLYLLAVSLRCLKCFSEALRVLDPLECHHPVYPRGFEERGLCNLALGHTVAAITAFSRAAALDPWSLVSWRALQTLYRDSKRKEDAAAAAQCCAALTALPTAVRTGYNGLYRIPSG